MPKTSSAIKASRQSQQRRKRLQPYKTHMKTMIRKIEDAIKAGNKDEALKLLPMVYKSIDTAAKKNLIHKKNAARKKSLMARMADSK